MNATRSRLNLERPTYGVATSVFVKTHFAFVGFCSHRRFLLQQKPMVDFYNKNQRSVGFWHKNREVLTKNQWSVSFCSDIACVELRALFVLFCFLVCSIALLIVIFAMWFLVIVASVASWFCMRRKCAATFSV